jgi:hypothetical protein
MTQAQIDSAKFLISKAMGNPPEIQEISGLYGEPIQEKQIIEFIHTEARDEKKLNGNGHDSAPLKA